jgi:hypothetical protein
VDQAVREQIGDPRRVVDVGLASRDVADVAGIGQDQFEPAFEDVPHWFPVDASRFHGDVRAAVHGEPVGQREQSGRGGGKAAHFVMLRSGHTTHAGHDGVLVHVESGAAGIENLHVACCEINGSGSSPRDRILVSVLAGMTARHHNTGCAQGCGSNCLAGSGHHSLGRPRSPLRVHVTPSVGSNRGLSASSFGVGQRPMNNCLHSMKCVYFLSFARAGQDDSNVIER